MPKAGGGWWPGSGGVSSGGGGRQGSDFQHSRGVERGGARLEWAVLDWNELGKGFYRSIGAGPVDGWERWRMEIDAIEALANGD